MLLSLYFSVLMIKEVIIAKENYVHFSSFFVNDFINYKIRGYLIITEIVSVIMFSFILLCSLFVTLFL